MPLISIVVPVYNVEHYMRQCLDSICGQTYRNIEVVVVDDGSTDGSGEVCDEYARRDPRVVVVHEKNGGLSMARNVGMKHAKGDYFMFVDSDDWVEPYFCEYALTMLKDNNVKLVAFGHERFYEEPGKKRVSKSVHVRKPKKISASRAIGFLLGRVVVYNYAWNKIYDRTLFEGVEYPVGRVYEDNAVTYKVVHRAGEVFLSDRVLYHYRRRETSISFNRYKPQNIKDRFQIWEERLEFLKVHYPEHVDFQIVHLAYEGLAAVTYCKGDAYKEFRKEAKSFLKENRECLLKKGKSVFFYLYFYCRPLLPVSLKIHHRMKG